MSLQIAFLGTGIMGAPMAVHLLNAGYNVHCFNRTKSKTRPIVEAGGVVFDSPQEAARRADIIITMVTDGPIVEELLFGDRGALTDTAASTGVLCIDMSTISPELTRQLAQRAAAQKVRMLDAPVTGGDIGAKNATLSIMVGGDRKDFESALPLFKVLGKSVTYCGAHGAGQAVKLCNQICGAMNLLGVCEALVLGEKMGVDPETIVQVVSAGAGNSWAMENLASKINVRDFAPGFMVDTQQKDMRLIAEAAEAVNVSLPGAALAQQLWRAAQAQGNGNEGIQAMAKVLRALSNLPDFKAT